MTTIDVTYQQPVAATEAINNIIEFFDVVSTRLSDGADISDLSPISLMSDLLPVFENADLISDEAEVSPEEFQRAAVNFGLTVLYRVRALGSDTTVRARLAERRLIAE